MKVKFGLLFLLLFLFLPITNVYASETVSGTLHNGVAEKHSFIPDAEGWYLFEFNNLSDTFLYVELLDNSGVRITDDAYVISAKSKESDYIYLKNQSYNVNVEMRFGTNDVDYDYNFTFNLESTDAGDTLENALDISNSYKGTILQANDVDYLRFKTPDGYSAVTITQGHTSSDTKFHVLYSDGLEIGTVGTKGYTFLSKKSEYFYIKITDSCSQVTHPEYTLTIKSVADISASKKYAKKLKTSKTSKINMAYDVDMFKFIPTKSGKFTFTIKNKDIKPYNVEFSIMNASEDDLAHGYVAKSKSVKRKVSLKKGKVYYIKISSLGVGSYLLKVN